MPTAVGGIDHNRATELGTRVLAQLDPKITGYAKHPADEERAIKGTTAGPCHAYEDFGFVGTVGTVWWNSKESSLRIFGLFKAKHHAQQAAEGRYHWREDHADIRGCTATTSSGSDAGPVAAWTPSWATETFWIWWRRGRQRRWWTSFEAITRTWEIS